MNKSEERRGVWKKPSTLEGQLEFYFCEENLSQDKYLKQKMDQEGYCEASVLAEFRRVLSLTGHEKRSPAVEQAVTAAADISSLLQTKTVHGKCFIRRARPYSLSEIRPPGHGGARSKVVQAGKDVPDGKNFREAGAVSSATCAPGHKTAQGQQGKISSEEIKKRKEEKKERKRIQAEREEANRRKRQRESGGGGEAKTGAKEEGGEGAKKAKKEKKEKEEGGPGEARRGQLRNELNQCCRHGSFGQAMVVVQRIRDAALPLAVDQYVQLLHLCAGADEEHWERGGELIKELLSGDSKVAVSEQLASGCLKLYDCLKQPVEALAMWEKVQHLELPRKRRLYAPLLSLLADGARLDAVLQVFRDAQTHAVDLLEEDFLHVAEACAANDDKEQLANVLQAMMELIYALQPATLSAMESIFSKQKRDCATVTVSPEQQPATCPHCSQQLRSIDLEPEELTEMCGQITSLAKVGANQTQAFEAFVQWLQRSPPPAAVIDGANVGYYSLRPDQGQTLSYQKVGAVVRWFQSRGQQPLVVMHARHFHANAPMTPQDRALVQSWRDNKILYSTPPKMNDDWFWLYAAVWSSKEKSDAVMVSNDQMRDHHFQMLSQRKFLKWRERHWVNFHFNEAAREPVLAFPTKFSLRMQHVEGDTQRWHFPHADTPNTWLCCAK